MTTEVKPKWFCRTHPTTSFLSTEKTENAQVILERIVTPKIQEVEILDETERGQSGFGSTGTAVARVAVPSPEDQELADMLGGDVPDLKRTTNSASTGRKKWRMRLIQTQTSHTMTPKSLKRISPKRE